MAEIDRFKNGEFAGAVAERLKSIDASLTDIRFELRDQRKQITAYQLGTARMRLQVRLLWAAAGVFTVTLLGLVLKMLFGGGVQ
jgi:hypothetical protein